ncbi:MAG: hypothetical protein LUG99_09015 [Lachnospiraceae bacterium]|nr:hypothetical protein [Lachnospiraceae bacterium]
MLTTKKTIMITGTSTIDGVAAERYRAEIDQENPEDTAIIATQSNKTLYKENRATCREDRAAFEEYVYTLQEEMLASDEESKS